jgi:hypothetical protein
LRSFGKLREPLEAIASLRERSLWSPWEPLGAPGGLWEPLRTSGTSRKLLKSLGIFVKFCESAWVLPRET